MIIRTVLGKTNLHKNWPRVMSLIYILFSKIRSPDSVKGLLDTVDDSDFNLACGNNKERIT